MEMKSKRKMDEESGGKKKCRAGADRTVDLELFEERSCDRCLLHRFGLENWNPSGVSYSCVTPDGALLVVCREDGELEFWETKTWSCIKKIVGGADQTPTGLCWTRNPPRLVWCTLEGDLVEWDLEQDCPRRSERVSGGGIWCLASSPVSDSLAVGCEDGVVWLYRLHDDGFQLLGQLQMESPRALCLDWEQDGMKLVVGYSDGSVRRWSLQSHPTSLNVGYEELRITLLPDADPSRSLYVCSVLTFYQTNEIICGDSFGRVSVWDGKYGTQLCSFQKHHGDVTLLKIVVQSSAIYLLSSGMDGSVVIYQRRGDQWEYVHLRRPHVHDITSLQVFQHDEKVSILTSSQDSTIRVLTMSSEGDIIQGYLKKKLMTLDLIPQRPLFHLSSSERLLMVTYKTCIEVWRFPMDPIEGMESKEDGEMVSIDARPQLLTKMKISGVEPIVSSSLSNDGQFMAFSTHNHLKLMKICLMDDKVILERIQLPKKILPSCKLAFSPNSKWLALMDRTNYLSIFDLETQRLCCKVMVPHDPPSCLDKLKIPFLIHPKSVEISPDGRLLCVQFHSSIGVYIIPNDFPAKGLQKTTTIKSNIPITSITTSTEVDVVYTTTIEGTLRKHNIQTLALQEWTERYFHNKQFHSIISTPKDRQSVVMCSGCMFVHFGLEHPRSSVMSSVVGMNPRFTHLDQDHRLLHLTFLNDRSLLLIQGDWKQVLKKRQAPLYRHRYGS